VAVIQGCKWPSGTQFAILITPSAIRGWGERGAVMSKSIAGKMLLGLCCLAVIGNLAVCCAGDGPVNGGDPLIIPPGTRTIEPTPSILNEVLTVLAAVVLPTLF
jgi:hypothetical protein